MLLPDANKNEELRIRQIRTFYHPRVLRPVKALAIVTHDLCVTIASVGN